eukprot:6220696-Prymnesium_polylepis.1
MRAVDSFSISISRRSSSTSFCAMSRANAAALTSASAAHSSSNNALRRWRSSSGMSGSPVSEKKYLVECEVSFSPLKDGGCTFASARPASLQRRSACTLASSAPASACSARWSG